MSAKPPASQLGELIDESCMSEQIPTEETELEETEWLPHPEFEKPDHWEENSHLSERAIQALNLSWTRVKVPELASDQILKNYYQAKNETLQLPSISFLVQRLHRFIANDCPIVIHFPIEKLETILTSGYYRNGFEVSPTRGNYRLAKESKMFDDTYKSSPAPERMKYGRFWFHDSKHPDPEKKTQACAYGSAYLVLRPEIRQTATFVAGNSTEKSRPVPVLYPIPYLLTLKEKLVHALLDRAFGLTDLLQITQTDLAYAYFECQLHGKLKLSEHVQTVVVEKKHLTTYQAGLDRWQTEAGVPHDVY